MWGGVGQGGGQGRGDGGGHQRAVWEQQGVHWFHLLGSLKNLTIGLIWLVTRRVGQGGGQGGGAGGSREVGGEVERVDKMWRPLKGEPAGRRPQGSADKENSNGNGNSSNNSSNCTNIDIAVQT